MRPDSRAPNGALEAILNYYLEPKDGGDTEIFAGLVKDKLRVHDAHGVHIEDIRGREPEFDLDVHGFQHLFQPAKVKDFSHPSRVTGAYYDEIKALLKQSTGATSVQPFSHIIRRDSRDAMLAACIGKQPTDIVAMSGPATFVHIDQSYAGAEEVFHQNVSATEAERLSKSRWAIINVWRPISTVERSPLALCDARSVRDEDLRDIMAYFPKEKAGGLEDVSRGDGFRLWNVAFKPEHTWYWCSDMTPDECWLIKCYDSSMDGRTRRAPHTSFEFPAQEWSLKGRESIEVRCLVFWENDPAT